MHTASRSDLELVHDTHSDQDTRTPLRHNPSLGASRHYNRSKYASGGKLPPTPRDSLSPVAATQQLSLSLSLALNGFQYGSLPGGYIRLLRPIVGLNDDALRFDVSIVARDDSPCYTAVSYTCGEGSATESIYLDGQRFRVRENLWSCLYILSRMAESSSWTHIWVDAICVNQKCPSDKADQIRFMDDIYRNAYLVSAWLGMEPEIEQTNEPQPFWQANCVELCQRSYWERSWIVQEFLLNKHVRLICGGQSIDSINFIEVFNDIRRSTDEQTIQEIATSEGLDDFMTCFDIGRPDIMETLIDDYQSNILYDAEMEIFTDTNNSPLTTWHSTAGSLLDKRLQAYEFGTMGTCASSLCELLLNFGDRQCQDPRDCVFALLGLLSSEERDALEKHFPEYSMPDDCFNILVLAHLQHFDEPGKSPAFDRLQSHASTRQLPFITTGRRFRNFIPDYIGYYQLTQALAALPVHI